MSDELSSPLTAQHYEGMSQPCPGICSRLLQDKGKFTPQNVNMNIKLLWSWNKLSSKQTSMWVSSSQMVKGKATGFWRQEWSHSPSWQREEASGSALPKLFLPWVRPRVLEPATQGGASSPHRSSFIKFRGERGLLTAIQRTFQQHHPWH